MKENTFFNLERLEDWLTNPYLKSFVSWFRYKFFFES